MYSVCTGWKSKIKSMYKLQCDLYVNMSVNDEEIYFARMMQ